MIIVFNGPPGSGKDVACDFLKKMGFKHIEFKSKLFKDTIRFYKVDEKWFYDGYTRDTKDVTEEKLSGLSRRQALINVSENVRKRLDGDEFYGKIAADGMVLGSDYCISDGGFTEEIGEVINKFGKDEIIFVRLFRDVNENDLKKCDMVITNPPWDRKILHETIEHFSNMKPTWLLFDSNWMFTKQSEKYINRYCLKIITVGRMIWIPGTKISGKDDVCWYLFDANKKENDLVSFEPRKSL